MDQSGVSVRRATVADALSVESLASLLATTFSIDPDAFTVIFERVINDEDTRILVPLTNEEQSMAICWVSFTTHSLRMVQLAGLRKCTWPTFRDAEELALHWNATSRHGQEVETPS